MTDLADIIRKADPPFRCTLDVAGVVCEYGTVPCHVNMQALGKGTGKKSDDTVAAGCRPCHHEVDNGKRLTREESQWYLLRGFAKTYIEACRRGKITFKV